MALSPALARGPRCVLVNVTSGEAMECLFNPAQLVERVDVRWAHLAVPGLSHEVLQFQNTGNRQLPEVDFYLDAFFAAEQPGHVDILNFRAFLRALTVPPRGTEGVPATSPPRVLFIWPDVLTMECVVASVAFQYRQLAVNGGVLVYAATVTFEEVLDARVTSEALRGEVR